MDRSAFDRLARLVGRAPRRAVLKAAVMTGVAGVAGVASAGFSPRVTTVAARKHKPLCRRSAASCRKRSRRCKARYCLKPRITVDATWGGPTDQHAYLFVPRRKNAPNSAPYLNFLCNEASSQCETAYPHACITDDPSGPGEGRTTIYDLLPGTYEYWVQVRGGAAAGEVSIKLRNRHGRVLRQYTSPANSSPGERGWHVFDINGKKGSVKNVNVLIAGNVPWDAHSNYQFVCTF